MTTPASQVPLDRPLYGATFGQAVSRFFRKYADFSGRASRSEYWWWFLVGVIVGVTFWILAVTTASTGMQISATGHRVPGPGFWVVIVALCVWDLIVIVPSLALSWRRLHDTNRSGAFYFLGFIPVIGGFVLLVLFLQPSDPAGARFDRA